MTLETCLVRRGAGRNRHRVTVRAMTSRAGSFLEVRGVIEVRAETRHLRE